MSRRKPAAKPQSRRTAQVRAVPSSMSRTRAVWLAFMASMTAVGGTLLLLEDRPVPRVDGLSLAPLLAAGAPATAETFLRPPAGLQRDRWQAIVIHHSGSPVGSPASIARQHESMNLKGLGHHFLVGNGSGMEDGELHLGYRWLDQLPGAHAGGPNGSWYNLHAISICLVGDGNRRPFTDVQIQRLLEVVSGLCRELDIPPERVYLHSDIAGTNDPGVLFPTAVLRQHLATLR